MPLDTEYITEYLRWLQDVRRVSPATVYNYEGTLVRWLTHLGGKPLTEATVEDVESFMSRLRDTGKPPAAATMSKDLVIVSAMYKFVGGRYGMRNPTLDAGRPRIDNRVPKAIPDRTWERLWGCRRLQDDARVALGLGFFCGLRRAEITALKVHHFHGHSIVGFDRKGGGDDTLEWHELVETFHTHLPALCPDPEDFYGPLRHLLKRDPEMSLLPWEGVHPTFVQIRKHSLHEGDLDPQRMSKRMRTWLRQANLPDGVITPHALRHSFVTNLLRVGLPLEVVCDLANHSDPKVTMRYTKTAGRLKQWNKDAARMDRTVNRFPSV